MTLVHAHLHRDDCPCTECVEYRTETERQHAAEIAERHRPTNARWDDDR